MTRTTVQGQEPSMSLPTALLVVTVGAAAVSSAAGWVAMAWAAGLGREVSVAGVAGAAVVAVVSLLGLGVMTPWKSRDVSGWMTMWLAATVVRLLLTPVSAYLLYSATSLRLTPFMLSVAVTYMVVLFCEAAVLALHVKRVT